MGEFPKPAGLYGWKAPEGWLAGQAGGERTGEASHQEKAWTFPTAGSESQRWSLAPSPPLLWASTAPGSSCTELVRSLLDARDKNTPQSGCAKMGSSWLVRLRSPG